RQPVKYTACSIHDANRASESRRLETRTAGPGPAVAAYEWPQSVLRYSISAFRSSADSAGPITPLISFSFLKSLRNSCPLFDLPRIEVSNSKPLSILSNL